jgi:hypothetical protein
VEECRYSEKIFSSIFAIRGSLWPQVPAVLAADNLSLALLDGGVDVPHNWRSSVRAHAPIVDTISIIQFNSIQFNSIQFINMLT